MTRILVVDDDPHIRQLARHYLARQGWNVLEAADGDAALAAEPADLAVLDLMLPGTDGWQVCRELRARGDLPILMLTARGATVDKVRGLALGADDYLVKPFDPEELIARIRALLRRYRIASAQVVEVGAIRLDRAAHAVACAGHDLVLPKKEFELLYELAEGQGRTLTREQLLERIWGYDYPGGDRTVDVHVKRLRDRFPEARSGFRIRTMRGLGYRLEVVP